MDTALALVAAGMGVAILPEGVVRRYQRTLLIRSLGNESAHSEIGIAAARERTNPMIENFIAIAKKADKEVTRYAGEDLSVFSITVFKTYS